MSATPAATATPSSGGSGQTEQSTTYFGSFTVPSYDFDIVGASGSFMTTAAPGCFVLNLQQPTSATAGDNAAFEGDVPFDPSTTETEDIYSGLFTSLSITNITADSGNGTFTLDNGVQGTMTITGSTTEAIAQPASVRPFKFAKSLRDRVLAEPRLRR